MDKKQEGLVCNRCPRKIFVYEISSKKRIFFFLDTLYAKFQAISYIQEEENFNHFPAKQPKANFHVWFGTFVNDEKNSSLLYSLG